jgi:Xaa-Pro aminopeptidase
LRSEKREKAVDLLKRKGLNGLVLFSNGTCSILSPSYLHYFSEFKPLGPRNAVILSASGETTLLVDPPWDSIRASRKSWIQDVRGTADFIRDLARIMRTSNLSGPVGLVGSEEMTQDLHTALQREANIVPADEIIEEIARNRTDKEIEVIRKTSRIADVGSKAFVELGRVGMREYELVAELEYAMRSSGADDTFILISSGKHNSEMHEPTDRRFQKEDIIIGEITPVCDGQYMQLCRTIILGEATPLLVDKYGILTRALEESLSMMRPGVLASLITTTMNGIIGAAGYQKYCNPPYMRSRGHGFGVGSIAPGPEITADMKTHLEEGQVVAVHPNQYLPETGYLACGETVLITDSGIERLARTENRLYHK